jgi:hypothetical protein
MTKGKAICKALKSVRKRIAEANEIDYQPRECHHEGECAGTCPACEAEVRYLERQISMRRRAGKAVVIAGLSISLGALTGCRQVQRTTGDEKNDPDTTQVDSLKVMELAGAVMEVPDSAGEDGKSDVKVVPTAKDHNMTVEALEVYAVGEVPDSVEENPENE